MNILNPARKITLLLLPFALMLLLLCGCSGYAISLDDIPEYSGAPYVEINGGKPFFKTSEITTTSFEDYSEPDALGRCGRALACLGVDLMPTEEREDIIAVTPSGWEYNGASNNNKYDFIEDKYLYNRCHLIGFKLSGENGNEKNLITGTRYMNVEGMLPFENEVANYILETENHVMYRVTPIFEGYDYVARGVLMEAYSVEDHGRGISFCVFVYNVQPGVSINYFNGRNAKSADNITDNFPSSDSDNAAEEEDDGTNCTYVLNISSKKFHLPGKSCANSVSEKNRLDYEGTRDALIDDGFSPCGICKP